MAKTNFFTVMRSVALVIGIFILMAVGGCLLYFYGSTEVNPWILFPCSAAIALATGTVLWRLWGKVTGSDSFWINFSVNAVVMTLLVSCAFLAVNYMTVDIDNEPERGVKIDRVYTKTRHKTRRVSRRTYAQGEPYKVYFVEIAFPDSTRKEIEVPFSTYRHTHSGDSAMIKTGKGCFGLTVINRHSLRIIPRKKVRHTRPRYERSGRWDDKDKRTQVAR